ncbi:hypothetical protein HMPREF3201_02391 [Megasphaera sp. MJR8396C]|nr:hypothetical protein HMPREF3201_02391 [Megasphaera sp. MJR8396C]
MFVVLTFDGKTFTNLRQSCFSEPLRILFFIKCNRRHDESLLLEKAMRRLHKYVCV